MKVEIQFRGYEPFAVDTDNGTCGVFERLTVSQASEAIENAANGGDEDGDGWVSSTIGGEDCRIRRV